jgi:hypothetical protein
LEDGFRITFLFGGSALESLLLKVPFPTCKLRGRELFLKLIVFESGAPDEFLEVTLFF